MKNQIIVFIILMLSIGLCCAQKNPLIKRDSLSLFFVSDSYKLKALDEELIVAAIDKRNNRFDSIVVNGYASQIDNKEYNLELSRKRVRSTAQFLTQTVDSSKLRLSAFGEQQGALSENRRVDILFFYNQIVEKRVLDEIIFVPGNDLIRTESLAQLNEIFEYIVENPNYNFRFIGHICCSPELPPDEDGVNSRTGRKGLSEDRARAVYNFLLDKGIDRERMTYIGKAYTEPLGGEDYLDRRVEVEIINLENN